MQAIGRKCLALLLTVSLLFSLIGTAAAGDRPSGPPAAPFSDTYGTRYQAAVDALYNIGVVAGKTSTAFEPLSGVTRAQMAALVMRAMGKAPRETSGNPFPDVSKSHWAAGQIAGAAEIGVIKGGTDGLFHPEELVLYPQVVAMLLRALSLEGNVSGEYPLGHVLLAKELGLIEDVDWGLDKPATRGDVAVMLYRAVFNIQRGGLGPTLSQEVHKRVGSISIQPESAALILGPTQLSAKLSDWAGNQLSRQLVWAVTAGDATVDLSGNLTVTGPAPVTVSAQSGETYGSRTYSVIKSLSIQPERSSVSAGGSVQLKAVGVTASNEEVSVNPAWTVTSGEGNVTDAGLLTTTGKSAVTVRAAMGKLSADATIPVVAGLAISPPSVIIGADRDTQFTATVTDASGKPVSLPVTWSVDGGGSVDQTGRFKAGTKGGTVVAKAGDASASAVVKVITRLDVSPSSGNFKKGDSPKFTVIAYTAENEVVTVPVQWEALPSSLGFFSADGQFFANNAGSGRAVASFGGLSAEVPISVAGPATGVRLTASPATLPANGSSTSVLTAQLVDASGSTASGVDNVFFTISNSSLGTLSQTLAKVENGYASVTLTVGTQSGTYAILASVPGSTIPAASLAFTTSAPSISHIALEAYPNPFMASIGSQTTITANLVDTAGAMLANPTGSPISVYLTPSNTVAGTLNSTLIQIGVGQKSGSVVFNGTSLPGTAVISGSSNYPVTSTSVTSQLVGGAYRLKIRPDTSETKADGVAEKVVYVEVQDVNGNVRTSDNSVFVSMNATKGNTSITTASQQSAWGVATFRLKSNTAGSFNVNVWSTSSGLIADSSTVTYTPGSAYRLSLVAEPSNSLAADGLTTGTLRAKILDVNGNLVTSALNEVRFIRESSSNLVTSMPLVTAATASGGQATLTITSRTSVGIDYFHAEADGLLQSSQVAVSTRITGVPVKLAVQSLSEATIAAGATTTVRVWVLDQLNQLVTGDNGRLVTLSGSNSAVVSTPTANVNGVATFTVTNTLSGGVTLTASAPGVTSDQVGRVLNVAPGTPDHIVLSLSPEGLAADSTSRATLSANLVDKYGNAATGYFAVNLSQTSSEFVFLNSTTVITGGSVLVTAKGAAGTTTISGTAASSSYVVLPVTISTYRSGTPAKVALDAVASKQAGNGSNNQVVVKARVLDENGNPVTSLNTGSDLTAMALSISGSAGVNSTNVTMNSNTGLSLYGITTNGVSMGGAAITNGIATFTLTNTKAETVTLTPIVYYKGVKLGSVPGAFTTTSGSAVQLTLSASATSVLTTTPTQVTVTAALADGYGNTAVGVGDTITFTSSASTLVSMPSTTIVGSTNGAASIVVTTKQNATGGDTIITAISSLLGTSANITLTTDLAPERPALSARDAFGTDTTVTSGEGGARVFIVVPVRKSKQDILVYVNGSAVKLYSGTGSSTEVKEIPAGSTSVTGYIKWVDLGGVGVKDVRAMVQTPLGTSPLSDVQTISVQN